MSISKEITRLEKSNIKITLTVPKDDVRSQYNEILKDLTKEVQIPGFRKGKVPKEVLERKFGEALKGEALGKILEKTVEEFFDDKNLPRNEKPLPYSRPEITEEPKLDFDQDLSFSMIYDVFPDVNVGNWKGLEVEVPQVEITESDINRELEEIRDRNSFVLDRDDGAEAKTGDIVTVNYCELDENGEKIPDTGRDDFVFTIGSKQSAYEMDDDVTGMKKDETKEVTKTFPEDSGEGEQLVKNPLAGQTVKLSITLTALKEKKLPDLDDELAQDVDEKFNTLDDLKNDIRNRLEKNLETRLKDIKVSKILEKIMENTPVTLPESMVRTELDGRLRNLARRFGTDTSKLMEMLAQSGDGLENINEKWRPTAEKALHSRLIVETLVEQQNFEVTDEETEKELEKIAADSGMPLDDVKKRYSEDNALDYLKESIKEHKFFDLLLAGNKINSGLKTNYLDFMDENR